MDFQVLCVAIIGLAFGALLCFAGYRFFLVLLPLWGFFAGFAVGAGALTTLFGEGFLITVTSWVAGVVIGLIFAVLSYFFYLIGIALLVGAFGFALGTGIMFALGFEPGVLAWAVGLVVAVVLAIAALALNFQKWIIVFATAFSGTSGIIGGLLLLLGRIDLAHLPGVMDASEGQLSNAVSAAIQDSPFWIIAYVALGIIGIIVQVYTTRNFSFDASSN